MSEEVVEKSEVTKAQELVNQSKNTLHVCEVAIGIVGNEPLRAPNATDVTACYGWLQGVHTNLQNDLAEREKKLKDALDAEEAAKKAAQA